MQNNIIIIGTELEGYQLAREFRKLDQKTPLTLITADGGRFYSKPKLSNALTQKMAAESIATASADDMRTQLNATIHTRSPIVTIDPDAKTVSIKELTLP